MDDDPGASPAPVGEGRVGAKRTKASRPRPSSLRPRKRRLRLNPGPFLVLGLGANVILGLLYSPLTAVRRVRIEGAPLEDQKRLTDILQQLRGVPCAQVHPRALESEALRNPELRTASLSRTPFGTAVLRVEPRVPVAEVLPRPGTALTADGVLYRSSVSLDALPKLRLPDGYPAVGLTLGNGWRAVDVARLAVLARELPSERPVGIVLDRGGRVCLNIGTGIVDLGSCDGLDEKVARLRSILAERPDLFATVATLHLVDVDAPTYTPRPLPRKNP